MRSDRVRPYKWSVNRGSGLFVFAFLLVSCAKILGLRDGKAQAACTSDAECAPGYGCLEKLGCRNRCIADSDCGAGSRCFKAFVTTACIPVSEGCGLADLGSGASDGCPQGTRCDGSVCRTQCDSADQCAGGQACVAGACVSADPIHESASAGGGATGTAGKAGTDADVANAGSGGTDTVDAAGDSGAAGARLAADAGGPGKTTLCSRGQTRSCAMDGSQGNCAKGVETCTQDGVWSACSITQKDADDCVVVGSDADCNGVPNEGCECVGTATRSCASDAFLGNCAKGTESCASGEWGPCSISKQATDSCAVVGDDANCNGTANESCPCVTGATRPCGPQIAQGICKQGTQTCANEAWGTCQGAVYAAARDCSSSADNDCDGKPDNTIDTLCTCAINTTQACDTHPGNDGKGPCKAGSQKCAAGAIGTSVWNACTGAVAPAANDTCDLGNDATCDGVANKGCTCINGTTQKCGNCASGTQTCAGGTWAACQNQLPPLQTFYNDADHDSYGDPGQTTQACATTPPTGYAARAGDCCDSDPHAFKGSTYSDSKPRVGCGGWDYDCDGAETYVTCFVDTNCNCCDQFGNCGNADACWTNSEPGCGKQAAFSDNTAGAVGCNLGCNIGPQTEYCQ